MTWRENISRLLLRYPEMAKFPYIWERAHPNGIVYANFPRYSADGSLCWMFLGGLKRRQFLYDGHFASLTLMRDVTFLVCLGLILGRRVGFMDGERWGSA